MEQSPSQLPEHIHLAYDRLFLVDWQDSSASAQYGIFPNTMDTLLARLGAQAMNMAIRSGITITSAYAIQQYGRLVATVDDKSILSELKSYQKLLNSKINIISPTIELVELKWAAPK